MDVSPTSSLKRRDLNDNDGMSLDEHVRRSNAIVDDAARDKVEKLSKIKVKSPPNLDYKAEKDALKRNREPVSVHSLVRHTWQGLCFWTLLTTVMPIIWWFPMSSRAATGREFLAGFLLSPFLLLIPGFQTLIQRSASVQMILRLGLMTGLISLHAPFPKLIDSANSFLDRFDRLPWQLSREPMVQRATFLSFGCSSALLLIAAVLSNSKSARQLSGQKATVLGLCNGLLIMLVLRAFYSTRNPFWLDLETNSSLLQFVGVSLLDFFFFAADDLPRQEEQTSTNGDRQTSSDSPAEQPVVLRSIFASLPVGFSIGGLLYVCHAFFGELSVVPRLCSLDATGPRPQPHGLLVFCALVAGLFVENRIWSPAYSRSRLIRFLCSLTFTSCLMSMYFSRSGQWVAFGSAIGLAFVVGLMMPSIFLSALHTRGFATFTIASMTYLALIFLNIWTVAYSFVPYGELLRERSDLLVGLLCLCMMCSIIGIDASTAGSPKKELNSTKQKKIKRTRSDASQDLFLFFLLFAGCTAFYARHIRATPLQMGKSDPTISAGVWTLSFGVSDTGQSASHNISQVIRDFNVDVMALLKVDTSRPFFSQEDLGEIIGRRQGYHVVFAPASVHHSWGLMLLSRYPVLNVSQELLPHPMGDPAPLLIVTLDISSARTDCDRFKLCSEVPKRLRVIVTHLNVDKYNFDGQLQGEAIGAAMRHTAGPKTTSLFLGAFNAKPNNLIMKRLISSGLRDIDHDDKNRWGQYILYSSKAGLTRLGFARLTHGGLSDTEAHFARFRLGPPADSLPKVKESSEEAAPRGPELSRPTSKDDKDDTEETDEKTHSAGKEKFLHDHNVRTHVHTSVLAKTVFPPKYGTYARDSSPEGRTRNIYHMFTPTYFLPQ